MGGGGGGSNFIGDLRQNYLLCNYKILYSKGIGFGQYRVWLWICMDREQNIDSDEYESMKRDDGYGN